jgi:hypothetical protein
MVGWWGKVEVYGLGWCGCVVTTWFEQSVQVGCSCASNVEQR